MSKSIKHHLVNWKLGKTICGLNFKSNSIRLASNEDNKWFDDFGNELDVSNYESIFCMNCLKLHEMDLIEQFKMESFMIQFDLQLPKSKRLRKAKTIKTKRNRIAGVKANPIDTPVESKPANSIPKSVKGLARDKRKAQAKSNPIVTESKCRIISKPNKPIEPTDLGWENENKELDSKEKPIELTPEMEVKKPLIDLSNGPVKIEVIESVDPLDDWNIGDPIDDEIFELVIGDNWKLIRHNKELDKWQFQSKSVVKGIPKWIADSEFILYKEASELINDGYCE
jgi:hypothetical protein